MRLADTLRPPQLRAALERPMRGPWRLCVETLPEQELFSQTPKPGSQSHFQLDTITHFVPILPFLSNGH